MRASTIINEYLRRRARVPELGERHIVCDWVREDEAPMIDETRYGELLSMLPDRIASELGKARLDRAGRGAMLKAGLGYEECLSAIIVDGTAVGSSSAETLLVPTNLLPANYLQPGGIPGRSLRLEARGRMTTLATAATLTFRWGSAITNVISTTRWAQSGAVVMDSTAQTNSMWRLNCGVTVRSVGSGGTVFAMGDVEPAAGAWTVANNSLSFMGSAGSTAPATATVDMTVPEYLSLTAQWSLTTAYSITPHRVILEALN
jgi:hypothetical protein